MLRYAPRKMASAVKPRNELRIIAGRWRGRRIRFPVGTTIRPTPDRVRETLFNWLAPHVRDANVADLFAGSGALGLEALSRGAARALFVERDARCVEALTAHCAAFCATGHEIVRGDALAILRTPRATNRAPFDIVFVDPPFDADVFDPALAAAAKALVPGGWIYLEAPSEWAQAQGEPLGLTLHRHLRAGAVHAHLWHRVGVSHDNQDHRSTP